MTQNQLRESSKLLSSFSVQPSSLTTAGAESAVSPGIEANHQVSTSSVDSNMKLVTGSVQSFAARDEVTKAEVLWTLKSVMSHQSYNSATGLNDLLMRMFPDSDIASKFRLGADKMAYIVKFGLAPYFYEELVSELNFAEHYVIAFDESMNRICQEEQMDMHVRFWDSSANRVANRYLGSSFLGHTAADDLVKGFMSTMKDLNSKRLIQISMDGPNANWSFLEKMKLKLERDPDDAKLLELGSCGLHIVHGAFIIILFIH